MEEEIKAAMRAALLAVFGEEELPEDRKDNGRE